MDIHFVQNPLFKHLDNSDANKSKGLKILLISKAEWAKGGETWRELVVLPNLKFASILSFATKILSLPTAVVKLVNSSTLQELSSTGELTELIHSSSLPKVIALVGGETVDKNVGKQGFSIPHLNVQRKL